MTSTLIKTQSSLTVKKVRIKAPYIYFWCIKLAHYLGKSLNHPLILNIVSKQLHSFNTPSPHDNTHWAWKRSLLKENCREIPELQEFLQYFITLWDQKGNMEIVIQPFYLNTSFFFLHSGYSQHCNINNAAEAVLGP